MVVGSINSKISKILGYVPQPNAYTCQSAAIGKVIGNPNVMAIRSDLERIGTPGDPGTMGSFLKTRVQSYKFKVDASLNDAKDALDDGATLITHGWFTGSGHVIGIVGYEPDPKTGSYRFIVDDPWSEFDFKSWRYPNPNLSGDNVRYSSYGIYASCVAGANVSHARSIYSRGELSSSMKNMWLHIIKN